MNKLKYWFKILTARWNPPRSFHPLVPGRPIIVFWQGKEELGFIWKSYLETAGHLVDMVQWDDQGKPNALLPSQVAEWQARLVQLKQPLLVSNFMPAKGLPALLLQDVQLSGWLLVSPSEDAAPSTFVWAGKPEEPAEPYLWITQINHHEIISI